MFSKPSSIMINIVTAPLWLAFFILTLRGGFGVLTLGKLTLQLFLWAAYAFALYSSWLWGGFGGGIIEESYEGILENVMTTISNLLIHVVGWGHCILNIYITRFGISRDKLLRSIRPNH